MAKALITIVAPVPHPDTRVRLGKLVEVLEQRLDAEWQFWGWSREGKSFQAGATSNADDKIRTILYGGGYGERALLLFYYPVWMIVVFVRCLFSKYKLYYCLGLETAFPLIIASVFRRDISVLFDNADNVSLSRNWPRLLKLLIERLELYVANSSELHVIPSAARWVSESSNSNVRVLRNTPSQTVLRRAQSLQNQIPAMPFDTPTGCPQIVVLLTGRLAATRGTDVVLRALEYIDLHFSEVRLHVVVAGRQLSDSAIAITKRTNCIFLGNLSNEEAVAWNWKCDVVLTLYDPSIQINRVAAPNKWGDCIATRTPFIVNKEVTTASEYLEVGAGFSYFPYHDHSQLALLLVQLAKEPKMLLNARRRLSHLAASPWDNEMDAIISEWLLIRAG